MQIQNVELTKKFRFEAAHRLGRGYCGKCANLHGHSWNGHIVVKRRDGKLDDYGMAVDYADIKNVIEPVVDALDHATIVDFEDKTTLTFLQREGHKHYVTDGNPTCEVLAIDLFNKWSQEFAQIGCEVVEVVIEETCTTRCRVTQKSFPD